MLLKSSEKITVEESVLNFAINLLCSIIQLKNIEHAINKIGFTSCSKQAQKNLVRRRIEKINLVNITNFMLCDIPFEACGYAIANVYLSLSDYTFVVI